MAPVALSWAHENLDNRIPAEGHFGRGPQIIAMPKEIKRTNIDD